MNTLLNFVYQIKQNPEYFVVLGLIFLAVASTVGGAAVFFRRRNVASERLTKHLSTSGRPIRPGKTPPLQEGSSGLIAKISNPLHRIAVPSSDALQKRVRLQLTQAGFRSRQAYRNYLSSKVLLSATLALVYFFRAMFFSINPMDILICVLLAIGGFFIPNIVLLQFSQKRQERILKGIPDTLDLMVVCVESGLGLDMTLKKVGEEVRPLCKDLSDELYLTNLEINAGKPREESLKSMALRTGVAEVQTLMNLLVQTSRFGTSLAKTLRIHADSMRTKRRQLAEEKAAKAAIKLLIPLVFFIFPAMFVVIVGPAGIRIAQNLLPALGGSP